MYYIKVVYLLLYAVLLKLMIWVYWSEHMSLWPSSPLLFQDREQTVDLVDSISEHENLGFPNWIGDNGDANIESMGNSKGEYSVYQVETYPLY
jgi:hypothetical protein